MSRYENDREVIRRIYNQAVENNTKFSANILPKDNIFSILNIVNNELMYCRVLKYLITTNWNSFKEKILCKNISEERWDNCNLKRAELEYECDSPCEAYPKKGRIDVLLETDKKQVIVIETKVYADDQEHQLFRYKKEMENHFKEYKYYILYLTLDGHKPTENSLMCEKHNQTCNINARCSRVSEKEYICISFRKNISEWLDSIISEFETDSIAKQFFEVINMTKNNYDQEIKLLSEDFNYAKIVLALNSAFPTFFDKIRNAFFEDVAKELHNNYQFKIESKNDKHNGEIWVYTLEKSGKSLHLCYENNFFLRIEEEWEYVNKEVFDSINNFEIDFGTCENKEAFGVKNYSDSSSEKLLEWSYWDKDRKDIVIKNIAYTASSFFNRVF